VIALDPTVANSAASTSVNNASAISLTDSQATDMKRFDLMMDQHARHLHGVEILHPHLKKAQNAS
jgi:citronellol/citronellal dehydrogenase